MRGAKEIHLIDPQIKQLYQIINLHDFCRMLLELIPFGEEMVLKVFTQVDLANPDQERNMDRLLLSYENTPLNIEIDLVEDRSLHDRSIESDTKVKIALGRGLDIFHPHDFKNPFNLANTDQKRRKCKAFEMTYFPSGSI